MKNIFVVVLLCFLVSLMVLTGCDSNTSGGSPSPVVTYTISFDANGGTGTMASVTVEKGASYTVPACGFTAPSLKRFIKWNDGSSDRASGDTITVSGNITLTAQWEAIPDVLSGSFSVSNSKKVRFSKGNLYWDGSAFKMYDNQYDCESSWDANKVDKFYWSKDKRVAFVLEYNEANTTYGITPDASDTFFANTDSSVIGASWVALSKDEWVYLLNSRTDAASKVGYATVCGAHGLILLPDTFTDPNKNNGSGAFVPKASTGWSANNYSAGADWNAMEEAGAVFLPASGLRSGVTVSIFGTGGYYWACSPVDATYSYILSFNDSSIQSAGDYNRACGLSVRLIVEE